MRAHHISFAVICAVCFALSACALIAPATAPKNEQKTPVVNIIALLPVESNTADTKAIKMLRTKLSEELRFKGYSQIASETIDSKLEPLTGNDKLKKSRAIPPQAIEELLGADGAMYCTLLENQSSTRLFYSPVTVAVRCELRSTKSGESLWNAEYRSTSRSFDLFRTDLKMKSVGGLEEALEEAVGKVMESLPYGPKLRG
ncbi:MAG: hypothetical protein EG826_13545 [Deltaproteobacteria bacterium]|nr:hypothetical protein [Deltaproteobacteria bacterium]